MSRVHGPDREVPADVSAVLGKLEQRYGSVPYNHTVLARRPSIFRGFRTMWGALEESGLIAARLADLVNLKVASLGGCGL